MRRVHFWRESEHRAPESTRYLEAKAEFRNVKRILGSGSQNGR